MTGPTWPCPSCTDVRDAIVRVDAVTICGTTLHFLKGDVPEVQRGRILGHEAVGTALRGRVSQARGGMAAVNTNERRR